MRLLQAGKAYHPHIGGIETVIRQVAESAAGAGWDSTVLAAGDTWRGSRDELDGVTVRRVGSAGRLLSLPLAPGYGRALRRDRADALLVHEPTLLGALATVGHRRMVRRRFDRIAVWWHSDIVRQRFAGPVYGPLQRHLLDLADDVIVATPNHVTSSAVLPAYDSKVRVIPYGVDLDRYRWDADRARRVEARRAAMPAGPIVLYAGRLARYKGIAELLSAMALVRDAHLVVVGQGPCEQLVHDSPLLAGGRMTLLPHLDDAAFVDMMWAADVFVLPSTQPSEAFGIVQVEAMACGKPVVTFDLPTGVTWVNRDGETGLVAPLGDVDALAGAIQRLVDDVDLRARLGAQAAAWARDTFPVELMVERTLAVCAGSSAVARPATTGA